VPPSPPQTVAPPRRGKAPIATLIALLALASGAEALTPAQAAAMDDENAGATCVVQDGVLVNPETDELCTLGEETIAFSGSAPSTSPRQEASGIRTPCPGFGCLRGPQPLRDRDKHFAYPDGPKGRTAPPAKEKTAEAKEQLPPQVCKLVDQHKANLQWGHTILLSLQKPFKGRTHMPETEKDLAKIGKHAEWFRDQIARAERVLKEQCDSAPKSAK
jgi:hypothetical protein